MGGFASDIQDRSSCIDKSFCLLERNCNRLSSGKDAISGETIRRNIEHPHDICRVPQSKRCLPIAEGFMEF